jgi:hypothetical protein
MKGGKVTSCRGLDTMLKTLVFFSVHCKPEVWPGMITLEWQSQKHYFDSPTAKSAAGIAAISAL